MNSLGYVVAVLILVLVAWVIGRNSAARKPAPQPEPEPKRFGRAEAEAAMEFVGTPDQMKPILGVVVGVLGYENAVADDVRRDIDTLDRGISDNVSRIESFEAYIREMQEANRRLQDQNNQSEARKVELQKVAAVCVTA